MALSEEENRLLCEVGPGTMMGNLLRRYWTPACLSVELPEPETQLRVRLLGEDLVAFRDTSGQVGLLDEHCPHRGASVYYGRNEECGLRCVYHGWKFDITGQCVDMPSEPRGFAGAIKMVAYPCHESGGIVWTYMGPSATMTPFRDFGTESLAPDQVRASKTYTDCNWVQTIDGNFDTVHASFLHMYNAIEFLPDDDTDEPGYPSIVMTGRNKRYGRTPRLELQDDFYGFRYAGIRKSPKDYDHVRVTTFVMPYGTQVPAMPFSTRHLWVVPIDDYSAWRYNFVTRPTGYDNPRQVDWIADTSGQARAQSRAVPGHPLAKQAGPNRAGVQERLYTAANEYGIDRSVQKDLSSTGTYSGIPDGGTQDYMVTETMGPIYDRTKEHLGTTDIAIVKLRATLLQAARGLAAGKEPPAVSGEHDYRSMRAAEKILAPGEDWRVLGTNDDPLVQEAEEALARQ